MPTVAYPHIEHTADGVPLLAGTTTKVVEVALDRIAYHWDADEIQRQHPHLSLGQIYAALTYYYDHKEEMDREIDGQLREVDQLRARTVDDSPVRKKLRDCGRLP